MNIEKEIQADRQAKLSVQYTPEEFSGFKRRAAKKIAKTSKIPGFRPGKAPYQVIVNHYGEEAVLHEAVDVILDNDYGRILEEADIKPSGAGNLETIESYDPPKFIFLVPLEPIVELGNYHELQKDYKLEEFDLSRVDAYITDLRRNSATIIPADHPAQEGNLVYFNLSGEFLNPGEDEDATITDKTPQQVVIPDEGETPAREWPFTGFSRALLGVDAGDIKEIQHTFPADHEDEEFQGKTAIFTVEVQSVKELELPEMDEDFLKAQGDFDSLEDFREFLEEQMRSRHQDSYEQGYFNELIEEIIQMSEINYPPQMMAQEEENVLEDIKSRLSNQNLDFNTYLNLRNTDEEAFMDEEVRPVAKHRLERSLVVDALIREEGLKIDQEELKEQINGLMSEIFTSRNVEEMQKQLGKEEFSRAISMEGFSRTMHIQLQDRLKLIATGQPIPDEDLEETEQETEAKIDEETIDNLKTEKPESENKNETDDISIEELDEQEPTDDSGVAESDE